MISIENVEVMGWEAAIRGMRNPMNSWDKSDSQYCEYPDCDEENTFCDYKCFRPANKGCCYEVGNNDLDLMTRLRNAGTDHRKFMRMITVYLDITAPLYWWKEFDTYKVGTVANSCSTMHKIAAKEFTLEDFSIEHLITREKPLFEGVDAPEPPNAIWLIHRTIQTLNQYRNLYLQTKDKKYWWQMIQLLPSSYNQRRTVMLNYEVLANIYKSRRNHKLDEWKGFCKWIGGGLPYPELIISPSTEDIKCNVILPSNDMIVGNTTPFDLKPENLRSIKYGTT